MKRVKIVSLIGAIIFEIIGIVCAVAGTAGFIKTKEFAGDAALVKAKVSSIEGNIGDEGDTDYTAYVTYEYEGMEYKRVRLDEYNSSLYEGKTIELYLDKDNPRHVRIKSVIYLLPIVFIGIGIIFLLIGVLILVLRAREDRKKKRIMDTGVRISAQVKGSIVDTSYTINSRHPYRLECVYYDELSGQPVICTSDIIWESPDKYMDKYVPVYVDREDRSRYVVDLKNIK